MKKREFGLVKLVSQLVLERVGYHRLLLSRPPLDDRTLPGDGLVFRLEPVRYNDRTEKLLDCYSSGSSLVAKKSVGLFAEGHHDLIRRFFFTLSVFEYPTGCFEYLYSMCEGARHIRITEAAPKNSPRITLETFGSPIAFIPPLSDRWCLVKDSPAVLVPGRTRHNRRNTKPGRMADRIQPPMQAMREEMDLFWWRL